jgi:exodeoxyribonuclease-3
VKIATFNINRRLPNLLHWLKTTKPNVVCLQELKAADKEFPEASIARAGYRAVARPFYVTREHQSEQTRLL